MLCPPAGMGHAHEQRLHDHHAGSRASHADHDHGSNGHSEQGNSPGAPDKCNLCSACCSVTPMLSSLPTVAMPQELAAIDFPSISAPAPSFISAGQERPPRSI